MTKVFPANMAFFANTPLVAPSIVIVNEMAQRISLLFRQMTHNFAAYDLAITSTCLRRVHKELIQCFKNLAVVISYIFQSLYSFITHPNLTKIRDFQGRFLTGKIMWHFLKIMGSLAKGSIIPFSDTVISLYSFVKFTIKAVKSPEILNAKWHNLAEFILNCPKVFYTGLSLLGNMCTLLQKNAITSYAYQIAGWGADFKPLPGIFVFYCDKLGPVVTGFRWWQKTSCFWEDVKAYTATRTFHSQSNEEKLISNLLYSGSACLGETIKLAVSIFLWVNLSSKLPEAFVPFISSIIEGAPSLTLTLAIASAGIGVGISYRQNAASFLFSKGINSEVKPTVE
jgi:hypothetical protein